MKLVIAALALSLAACEQPKAITGADGPAVTMVQFNQLKDGMTYEQAVAVLGSPGVEQSSNSIGGTKTVMYAWNGNTMGGNMNAMFQNNKLVSKAQFGLE